AFMTKATVVAAAGDDGMEMQDPNETIDRGTMTSPGSALNTIAVVTLDESLDAVYDEASSGPQTATDWVVAAELFPEEPADPMNMPPTEDPVEEARPGPDITAPGTRLRLAASVASPPESTNAFSEFWEGTSIGSAIVAGAVALLHDVGNERGLWPEGRPNSVLTRALLLNSARRLETGFSNMGMPGMAPSMQNPVDESRTWITMQALDDEIGAGFLDLRRLSQQFLDADVKDVRNLAGFIGRQVPDPNVVNAMLPPEDPRSNDMIWMYDVPVPANNPFLSGTQPNVPFVTFEFNSVLFPQGRTNPNALGPGGPGGGGPATDQIPSLDPKGRNASIFHEANPDYTIDGKRKDAYAAALEELNMPVRARLLQYGGGVGPDWTDPGGGGADIPPREIDDPQFPVGRPELPNSPFGPQRRTGWDLGSIGLGQIDIPIGTVTEGSRIAVT
ncbi:MAG: S8 family serine peptidase, partial [Planctomycetota bacterium]|nr:S8 family serine peptidase [Planctomycetota bacterium]